MTSEASADATREARVRTVFWVVLWLSVVVALVAHLLEADATRVSVAAGIAAALAVWLHLVHRVHRRSFGGEPATTVMLVGVQLALIGLLIVDSSYLVVLFGAYSMTFAFATPASRALVHSAVVTVVWVWAWIRWDLPTGGIITPVLVWAMLSAVHHFSEQVAQQNRERGALLDELHRTRAELAAAERDRGTLAERERLAAEIHDTLAQGFTSIVLVSEATKMQVADLDRAIIDRHLGLIEETARSNLSEARRLVAALRPVALEGRSLADALQSVVHQFAARTGVEARFVGPEGADGVGLGGEADVVMLRLVQEALANCEKHAQATTVEVTLERAGAASARVTVHDDGRGFRPGEVRAVVDGVSGAGLDLARRRVESLNGDLTVESAPGRGTTVTGIVRGVGPPNTGDAS